MAAAGAATKLGFSRGGIKAVTADAMKCRLAALAFEPGMLPTVVIKPQREERDPNQSAGYGGGEGNFEHGVTPAPRAG